MRVLAIERGCSQHDVDCRGDVARLGSDGTHAAFGIKLQVSAGLRINALKSGDHLPRCHARQIDLTKCEAKASVPAEAAGGHGFSDAPLELCALRENQVMAR